MEEFKAFKKILFPVDLSKVTPEIAPWVLQMAERFGAEIHLIFVVRNLHHYDSMGTTFPQTIEAFLEELVANAEKRIEEFASKGLKRYPHVETKVVVGDPSEEILRYVRNENIDLIVMGTHGRKGLDRILFGSVAEHVVRMSPVPVLTINPYRVNRRE
jgi:nucleotide-binding universal stress UspA family protein